MAEGTILLSMARVFQEETTEAKGTTAKACSVGSKGSKEAALSGAE